MKYLWQVSLCCLLAGGPALAQRGGGTSGGGAHGGYIGGGMPGGGIGGGTFTGGSVNNGFAGGFNGGFAFRNGFNTGFNPGRIAPVFSGFDNRFFFGRNVNGAGYNSMGFYGNGFQASGYNASGFYGNGPAGNRLHGSGFSDGYYGVYWPYFYADYWPASEYSSYVPTSGSYNPAEYRYTAYQSSANVAMVYPQAPAPLSAERARPVIREYDQNGLEIRPNGSPLYLIAFKDHTIRMATTYRVDGNTLRYSTPEKEDKEAALDTVDRALTLQLNRERQVAIQLPPQ